jgi:hypothetical protein
MLDFKEFRMASSYASSPIQQKIEIVSKLVGKPFWALNSTVQALLGYFEFTPTIKWKYVVDPESGLTILESKKDLLALEKIRAMADSLLK